LGGWWRCLHCSFDNPCKLESEKYDGGLVYHGDDSLLSIVGRGRVLIRIPNGKVKGINGVLNNPSLAGNILSISKLNDVGVQVIFTNKGCKMV